MSNTITHVGFADESNWNTGRWRSLGLITLEEKYLPAVEEELWAILAESGVSEFKWKRLGSARERFVAEKIIRFAAEKAMHRKLRIDVLIWDIEDNRHKIRGRDDVKNLQRMYFHLFRNVLRLRWPDGAIWRLHPDEHTAMDWSTIEDFLAITSIRVEHTPPLLSGGLFRSRLRVEFGIQEIQPRRSEDTPLLQVADLFAGMGTFSHERFGLYQTWLHHERSAVQAPLPLEFEGNDKKARFSRSEQERFHVLSVFDDICKAHKLGVSLKTWQGLRTPDPRKPINFWVYEPQHPEDKAPVKG